MTLHEAIIAGLLKAQALNLTKPDDVSFAVQAAIDAAGLKVIRQQSERQTFQGRTADQYRD